jgi:hypothetical protein
MRVLALVVMLLVLTGCAIHNEGDPRHIPNASTSAPFDLVEKHMPWLEHLDKIAAEEYDEESNNCVHKAEKFTKEAEALGHPCKQLVVYTEDGLHRLIYVDNPMINNGFIVDAVTGEIYPCRAKSERIIGETIEHENLGSLDHIKGEE